VRGNKESLSQRVAADTARGMCRDASTAGEGVTWLHQWKMRDAVPVGEGAHEPLGVDRVGVVGYSAAGYLAAHTASRKDLGAAACAAFYAAPQVTKAVMPQGSDEAGCRRRT